MHDIGDPGILFGPREMRLYPNGKLAAHILGGSGFGREGVSAAEVIGVAGVEKKFDDYLRDPANGSKPLQLSLDLTIQAAVEQVLYGGMKIMNAKGASAVLMNAHTGEVISAASLPSFDPNDRPRPPTSGFDPSDSPLFNRYVQGVYELGSVFKIFTAAQAVQLGLVNSETIIDTSGPMKIGRFPIGEFNGKNYGKISVADVIFAPKPQAVFHGRANLFGGCIQLVAAPRTCRADRGSVFFRWHCRSHSAEETMNQAFRRSRNLRARRPTLCKPLQATIWSRLLAIGAIVPRRSLRQVLRWSEV